MSVEICLRFLTFKGTFVHQTSCAREYFFTNICLTDRSAPLSSGSSVNIADVIFQRSLASTVSKYVCCTFYRICLISNISNSCKGVNSTSSLLINLTYCSCFLCGYPSISIYIGDSQGVCADKSFNFKKKKNSITEEKKNVWKLLSSNKTVNYRKQAGRLGWQG